jgi:hypothetical protein
MTKPEYGNVTVSKVTYDWYKKNFESNKERLRKKGINSFAGYITSRLEELMERDEIFGRYAPFLEEFGYDDDGSTVYIKDNKKQRVVGVRFNGDQLVCDVDEKNDCVHVGFAYSLPKVYRAMESLGIKLNRRQLVEPAAKAHSLSQT